MTASKLAVMRLNYPTISAGMEPREHALATSLQGICVPISIEYMVVEAMNDFLRKNGEHPAA